MRKTELKVPIEPYRFSPHWLVGAKTLFIDRFSPQVELIYKPGADYAGGTLRIFRDQDPSTRKTPRLSRRNRIKSVFRQPQKIDLKASLLIDLRFENFFNWSHQLNRYLPLSLLLRQTFASAGECVTILLPTAMPNLMETVYRQFGFNVLTTDGLVVGYRMGWALDDENAIMSHVHHMVRPFTEQEPNSSIPKVEGLPQKVFLSRRGTRAIANGKEIEVLLASRGYSTVYAEDYAPLVQIALLRQATHVVAIHGAALGPLLYRLPNSPFELLEILPVGHMTNFFQMMCDQVGGRYCGIRGRIKPQYVTQAYGEKPFLRYSLDAFEVDPESINIGLEILKQGTIIEDYPSRWRMAN